MSLNELLYDNVNLDVSQSYAFECGLILKHPLQELDRLYRTKLLDHSFDNFGVSNATIYVSYCHGKLPYTKAPFHALVSCVPKDERTWRLWIIKFQELFVLLLGMYLQLLRNLALLVYRLAPQLHAICRHRGCGVSFFSSFVVVVNST